MWNKNILTPVTDMRKVELIKIYKNMKEEICCNEIFKINEKYLDKKMNINCLKTEK